MREPPGSAGLPPPDLPSCVHHGLEALDRHVAGDRVARAEAVVPRLLPEARALLEHLPVDVVVAAPAEGVHVDAAEEPDAGAVQLDPAFEGRDLVLVGMLGI